MRHLIKDHDQVWSFGCFDHSFLGLCDNGHFQFHLLLAMVYNPHLSGRYRFKSSCTCSIKIGF